MAYPVKVAAWKIHYNDTDNGRGGLFVPGFQPFRGEVAPAA
jgi:hypothetical protein